MDTITHTLFGLTLYGAIDKKDMSPQLKASLFAATLAGSQIPDIDVLVNVTEYGRVMQQMWHRGITHSIFLVPVWAFLLYFIARLIWKVDDKRVFWWAMLAVFIHDTSDLFNTWGTGFLEPLSAHRITFGVIPIVDFVFWFIMLTAFIVSRKKAAEKRFNVFRIAWLAMLLHVTLQSLQGYVLYDEAKEKYDEVALAAGFVPTQFQVIGKKDDTVEISKDSIFLAPEKQAVLKSKDDADLTPLFKQKPEAKTLYDWSPFVVVVEDNGKLGIYDPRFYRNGESFLYEYIEKQPR
ncbi:metal-dependent hydrolase [Fictibacillus aquaticus]|uniref:Hydrolase n=1 Tax=Fictibacillus aquaticus TaxID=2021314 RepID=A0A235F536_9BACL|nr:metal-dependent hydrolase [Fictibacillus aquaticus]OYD56304.1 hydrolase [Fictibacillus aquaticus]